MRCGEAAQQRGEELCVALVAGMSFSESVALRVATT